jgi:SAM-dependent methyltransferase
MIDVLRTKATEAEIPVVCGDMATTHVDGEFSLVYLVFNTISNLRTQAEQVECFRNAARHLAPGGRFVIELWVPPLRSMPPGQTAVPFDVSDGHLGFDTYDVVTQECASHHYTKEADGTVRYSVGHFRYVWPAELDLMAQLAGLERETRYADWSRAPFTTDSTSHVSIYRLPV